MVIKFSFVFIFRNASEQTNQKKKNKQQPNLTAIKDYFYVTQKPL